jgi:hypothetical protein
MFCGLSPSLLLPYVFDSGGTRGADGGAFARRNRCPYSGLFVVGPLPLLDLAGVGAIDAVP